MKQIELNMLTDKGLEPIKGWVLTGMYTSGLAIAELPNNGGTFSYGVTHIPTGIAIIRGRTTDMNLVASMLRKLWKHMSPGEKEMMRLKDKPSIEKHECFDAFATNVLSVDQALQHKVQQAISQEIREERMSKS